MPLGRVWGEEHIGSGGKNLSARSKHFNRRFQAQNDIFGGRLIHGN